VDEGRIAIRVTIKLIGPFIYGAGFSEKEIEIPEASTIEGLLSLVGLDASRPRIVTRNGKAVAPGETLKAGDRIVISPLYSGG